MRPDFRKHPDSPVEYRPVSTVVILGAGPIGSAVAHRLAQRARVRHVRIVDEQADVAAGKALDIRQSAPLEPFDTIIDGTGDELAAVVGDVVIVADEVAGGEWRDERGLALVRRLLRAGATAPFVFAGPAQIPLMEASYRELKVPRTRLVGSAAGAMVGVVKAMAGLEMAHASLDLAVVGRPPALVVGWTAASADGMLVSDRVPAHRLLAISQALPRLWPPGPYAIASATAPTVEAILDGSRRRQFAMTIVDGEFGQRGTAIMLPLELGHGRVQSHTIPSLSPQERTEMLNGLP